MSRAALRCLALLPHLLAIGLALFAFAAAYGSISPGSNADFWSQFYHFFRSVLAIPLSALFVVLIIVVGVSDSEERQPPTDEIDKLLSLKRSGNLTSTIPRRQNRAPRVVTTSPPTSSQFDGDDLDRLVHLKRQTTYTAVAA